jgi:hypothetical protein
VVLGPNDHPGPGDHAVTRTNAIGSVVALEDGFLAGGRDRHWDFTALDGLTSEVRHIEYVGVDDGGIDGPSLFPGATFAARRTNPAGGRVDGWTYYSETDGGRLLHGAYLDAARPAEQLDPAVVQRPPVLALPAPLSFGQEWTVRSSYELTLDVLGPITTEQTETIESRVDAFGTVLLPGLGPHRCLRIHTLTRTEAVAGGFLPLGTVYLRAYAWIAEGLGEVARVTSEPHSDIVGPFGLPEEEFRRASLVEFQTENSRAVAIQWRRGDVNADGAHDLSDALTLLGFLFLGEGPLGCARTGDVNGDGTLDVSDALALLAYLFGGGTAPEPPFARCGAGANSSAELECTVYPACD